MRAPGRHLPALALAALLLPVSTARAQTVVDLDLPSAGQLLSSVGRGAALPMLTKLANNERQRANVRVVCREDPATLLMLAEGLRFDYDGSGRHYIPELTVWHVAGGTGAWIYLVGSLLDPGAVLLAQDLDLLKGMLAFEILQHLKAATLSVEDGRKKALALGIEAEVREDEEGGRSISFFGHGSDKDRIAGKLFVFEPIEYALR